jgi:hypothetical protein
MVMSLSFDIVNVFRALPWCKFTDVSNANLERFFLFVLITISGGHDIIDFS